MDDDHVNASYDISSGEMNIKIPKETPGEEFPDLDLLTKLLAPKSANKVPERPLIEIIGGDDGDNKDDNELFEKEGERKPYENNNDDFLIRELNSNNSNDNVNEKQTSKPLIQEIFSDDEDEAKKMYNLIGKGNI